MVAAKTDRRSRRTQARTRTRAARLGAAYRLIGQTKSGQAATFAHDNNSNMTTKWHQGGSPQTMQHDAADRLTTMQIGGTTTTMQWGARGVLARQYETGVIKATYGYTDINNNLWQTNEVGSLTTATYDGDNLRRKIVAGSLTTTFVWDGSDYLQTRPSSGDSTLLTVLDGEVVGHVKGAEKRDYIVDPLGSVVAYLNDSQTLTDQFEYWPYGELVGEIEEGTGPLLWVGSLGYFRDSDLRTYIRAREYRQDLGSWMQLDPLWPARSALRYGRSNPFRFVDPSGLTTLALTGLVASTGSGAAVGGAVVTIGIGVGVVGGAAIGGAIIGDAIDKSTGGRYGRFLCKFFRVDCEGLDYLPPSLPAPIPRYRPFPNCPPAVPRPRNWPIEPIPWDSPIPDEDIPYIGDDIPMLPPEDPCGPPCEQYCFRIIGYWDQYLHCIDICTKMCVATRGLFPREGDSV